MTPDKEPKTITMDAFERAAIKNALNLQKKSLERAVKNLEMMGRKATAEATDHELSAVCKLIFKITEGS